MASWTVCESRIARLCGSRASGSLEQKQLRQERQQLQALQQRFALVESRAVLETCRRDAGPTRCSGGPLGPGAKPASGIHRTRARPRGQRAGQLTQEMRTQGHNLYQQLAGALPPAQLAALNKVLARPVLTLGAEDFQLDGQALSKLGRCQW